MPGNGDVTGGTCTVEFEHRPKNGNPPQQLRKYTDLNEDCPIEVTMTITRGGKKTDSHVVLLGIGENLHIEWKGK